MSSMIGRKLGHYVILDAIGAGGMGEVYRARDETLRRDVALKVLPLEDAADPDARARLLREARLASTLNHPHVCTIYEAGSDGDLSFIAMELVQGRSLAEKIPATGLALSEVIRFGIQIADALAHAHAHGVIHRDLKPSNVVITSGGQAKVLDFGLARRVVTDAAATLSLTHGPRTEAGAVAGTTPFMAPEILEGRPGDDRRDIWAFGVMLHQMASGRLPFEGRTQFEIAAKILNAEPARLPDSVPATLRALIRRCLEKAPDQRIQQASEIRAALETIREQPFETPNIHSISPPRPDRRKAIVARGLILLAGLVVSTMILMFGLRRGCTTSTPVIHGLAVLPLLNLSGDKEQEFFTDGMTEELINRLARVGSIKVIARGSIMSYKGTRKTLHEIGRELGVDALVEGSVSRAGDRVRVRVQMARSSGENLWADAYERDLRDVLVLQSDIARSIVEKIQAHLEPDVKQKLAMARRVDPDAYQEYLRGRHAWDAYTVAGFRQAEQHFQSAVQIDPTYAPAWAGLADAIYGLSNMASAPTAAIPRARAAAQKALEHDPGLAEGNTSLGIVKLVYDWDWAGAEQSFQRALTAKPNDANAHWWRGHLLVVRGRADEGLIEGRRAMELDPLSTWYRVSHGWHLRLAGRYDDAVRHLREAAQLQPNSYALSIGLGQALMDVGDGVGAVRELEKTVSIEENNDGLANLACAYGRAGRRADAQRVILKLLGRRETAFVPAASLAVAYAGIQDREQTLRWLEAGLEDHSEGLLFLELERVYDFVRDHPRFRAVVARVGLNR